MRALPLAGGTAVVILSLAASLAAVFSMAAASLLGSELNIPSKGLILYSKGQNWRRGVCGRRGISHSMSATLLGCDACIEIGFLGSAWMNGESECSTSGKFTAICPFSSANEDVVGSSWH
jgi:hypothetical protein